MLQPGVESEKNSESIPLDSETGSSQHVIPNLENQELARVKRLMKWIVWSYRLGFSLLVLLAIPFSILGAADFGDLATASLVSVILGIVMIVFSFLKQKKEFKKIKNRSDEYWNSNSEMVAFKLLEIKKISKCLNIFGYVFFSFAFIGAILGAIGTVHDISMLSKVGANIPIFGLVGERATSVLKKGTKAEKEFLKLKGSIFELKEVVSSGS